MQPIEPIEQTYVSMHMTADQQIRAKALECATRQFAGKIVMYSEMRDTCVRFECYIRDGKT